MAAAKPAYVKKLEDRVAELEAKFEHYQAIVANRLGFDPFAEVVDLAFTGKHTDVLGPER